MQLWPPDWDVELIYFTNFVLNMLSTVGALI